MYTRSTAQSAKSEANVRWNSQPKSINQGCGKKWWYLSPSRDRSFFCFAFFFHQKVGKMSVERKKGFGPQLDPFLDVEKFVKFGISNYKQKSGHRCIFHFFLLFPPRRPPYPSRSGGENLISNVYSFFLEFSTFFSFSSQPGRWGSNFSLDDSRINTNQFS